MCHFTNFANSSCSYPHRLISWQLFVFTLAYLFPPEQRTFSPFLEFFLSGLTPLSRFDLPLPAYTYLRNQGSLDLPILHVLRCGSPLRDLIHCSLHLESQPARPVLHDLLPCLDQLSHKELHLANMASVECAVRWRSSVVYSA